MLLAIETSSRVGSVALHDGIALVGEKSFTHGLQNAAKVLPLIDELCREHGITAKGITDIAVSIGPGSFTGLRIGVTLAKTLAFATGAKLLAVPTLPVIASNAPADAQWVMPILDAKRDQVFAAVYRREKQKAESRKQKAHLDEVEPPATGPPAGTAGTGAPAAADPGRRSEPAPAAPGVCCQSPIPDRGSPEDLWWPKAATVAHLALQLREQGAYADPFKLTPLYIRKPEAQERMEMGLLKHLEG